MKHILGYRIFNENSKVFPKVVLCDFFDTWGMKLKDYYTGSDGSSHRIKFEKKDSFSVQIIDTSSSTLDIDKITIINIWGQGEFIYKILRNEYTKNYGFINIVKDLIKKGFNIKVNLGRPVFSDDYDFLNDVTPKMGANIFKNFVGLSEILKFIEGAPNWWKYRSYTLPAFLKSAEPDDIKNWWKHIKNSPDIFKILHFLKTNFRNTKKATEISTDCVGYYERFKSIIGEKEIEAIELGENMGGLGF